MRLAVSPREDVVFESEEELHDTLSHEEFSPQEEFDDWMVSLRRDQRQMLSVKFMEHFRNQLNFGAKAAATEAGSIVGYNKKTIRHHQKRMRVNFHSRYRGSTSSTVSNTTKLSTTRLQNWSRNMPSSRGNQT